MTWKLRPEKAVLWVKRWVTTLVYATCNWTVLALDETFLSMCWTSRAIIFRFKLSDRCFSYFMAAMFVSLRRLHTKLYKFVWHTSANNARMKNRRDLILGEVVYISIIYRIPDSWLFHWMVTIFSFDYMTDENRELNQVGGNYKKLSSLRNRNFYSHRCVSCRTISLPSFNGLCCKLAKIAAFKYFIYNI